MSFNHTRHTTHSMEVQFLKLLLRAVVVLLCLVIEVKLCVKIKLLFYLRLRKIITGKRERTKQRIIHFFHQLQHTIQRSCFCRLKRKTGPKICIFLNQNGRWIILCLTATKKVTKLRMSIQIGSIQ